MTETEGSLYPDLIASLLLVAVSAVGLGILGLVVGGGVATFPYTYSFDLAPRGEAVASAARLVEALTEANPGATVRLADGAVVITGRREELSLPDLRTVLSEHGYRANRFTMGLDFRPSVIASTITSSMQVMVILFCGLPFVLWVLGFGYRHRLRTRHPRVSVPVAVLWGVGGGGVLTIAGHALSLMLDAVGWSVSEQPFITEIGDSGAVPVGLLAIAALVLAPIGEELFFRGWLFVALDDTGTKVVAYAVSALAFATLHLFPPAIPVYVLYGLGLAAIYNHTRSLLSPILAHATVNLVALILLLV